MSSTLNDIKTNNWAISLDNPREIVQGVNEISQCILIILSTQKGSDPFRPDFGCDILNYIDLPILQAKANIVKEILEAIQIWETRVTIDAIECKIEESKLIFSIQWVLADNENVGANVPFTVNTQ